MILINLLPPELRRARRTGVSPVMMAAAAGVAIILALTALLLWVNLSRIKAAEALLAQREEELIVATAEADKVKKIEAEIASFEKLHGTITQLIARKVFWARTLDDFANLITQQADNRWTMEGYEVCCTSLTIAPAAAPTVARRGGAAAAGETVTYSFRTTFKLLGEKRDQAGDYVRSFFKTVDMSRFWRQNGFSGRSEDPFKGDQPRFVQEINRVVTDLPLEWRRVKVLPVAAKGGKK